MIRIGARRYSTNGPGFLSDLLSRIEAIPENAAKDSLKKPSSVASSKASKQEFLKRNSKLNVGNHPLSRFGGGSNRKTSNDNNNNNTYNNNNNNNRRQFGESKASTGASGAGTSGARPARRAPIARRAAPVQKDTKTSKESVSKKLEYVDYQPEVQHNLIHARSTQLLHSRGARVASVSKEILNELNYPYQMPKALIDAAPERANNRFILQKSTFNTEVLIETLKQKLDASLKGRFASIDSQTNKIPKDLQEHAAFVNKNLSLNPTLSLEQRQRVYNAASGISPVKLLVEGAHWIKK